MPGTTISTRINKMLISLLFLIFCATVHGCPKELSLVRSPLWKTQQIPGQKVDVFCSTGKPFACPYIPPNNIAHWLQFTSPLPGSLGLSYAISPECVGNSSQLTLDQVLLVGDKDPSLRQNGTFTISAFGAEIGRILLDNPFEWSKFNFSFAAKNPPLQTSDLQFQYQLTSSVQRTLTVLTIGSISVET